MTFAFSCANIKSNFTGTETNPSVSGHFSKRTKQTKKVNSMKHEETTRGNCWIIRKQFKSSGGNYILDSGWFCTWKEHRARSYVIKDLPVNSAHLLALWPPLRQVTQSLWGSVTLLLWRNDDTNRSHRSGYESSGKANHSVRLSLCTYYVNLVGTKPLSPVLRKESSYKGWSLPLCSGNCLHCLGEI